MRQVPTGQLPTRTTTYNTANDETNWQPENSLLWSVVVQ